MTKKEFVMMYVASHYVRESRDIMEIWTLEQSVSHFIKRGTEVFEVVESQLRHLDEK